MFFGGSRAFRLLTDCMLASHPITASLLHKLLDGAPCRLGILGRNDFFLDSYLFIFAFHRLLAAQHLVRNILQCERSSSLEALIGFEQVRQLYLLVLVHLFLGKQSFPDLKQLSIIRLSLVFLFNKLRLRETVSDRRLADLLPSTLDNV